jgi:hypothetical protein
VICSEWQLAEEGVFVSNLGVLDLSLPTQVIRPIHDHTEVAAAEFIPLSWVVAIPHGLVCAARA